jgi:hypothetical protein
MGWMTMDYNLTGSIATNVNLTQPFIAYIFLFMTTLITASAGIVGVYIGQHYISKSERERYLKNRDKEQDEKKRLSYYKFIEVFTAPFLTTNSEKSDSFHYLKACLDLNEFGNLNCRESISIQYIDMNDKLKKRNINSLEDLIIFIITLRSMSICNQQSIEHFPNLFEELRFKAAKAFIPLIKGKLNRTES